MKQGSGQYDLLPPTFGEIGRTIRHPASAAGLAFEDDPAAGQRLDEALHDTASKNPEALPLLEFILDELYNRRTDSRLLTWSAYRELGEIEAQSDITPSPSSKVSIPLCGPSCRPCSDRW